MDLKRLRYFCTVAEQGQISRAAAVLNMAQPPLSQRLRELEAELGCELLLRQGRSVTLTEAGTLLYHRARNILRAVDDARDEVIRSGSQTGPALRFGLSPTCRKVWLSHFARLRAQVPDRRLGVVVADSSYLEYLLQTAQIDVALMQPPLQPDNLVVQSVARSPSMAVAPAGLLPAGETEVSLAELARHPLLLLRRSVGVGSYERLLQAFQAASLHAEVALYSSDVELLLDLLSQGMAAVAVVPGSELDPPPAGCEVRPIALDLPDYQLSLVSRAGALDEALRARLLAVWREA